MVDGLENGVLGRAASHMVGSFPKAMGRPNEEAREDELNEVRGPITANGIIEQSDGLTDAKLAFNWEL